MQDERSGRLLFLWNPQRRVRAENSKLCKQYGGKLLGGGYTFGKDTYCRTKEAVGKKE